MYLMFWIIILIMLVVAVCVDIKHRKIPNKLNYGYALAGLAIAFFRGGLHGLAYGMVGVLIPVICLMPLFAFGVIGAGDIKLLGALGGFFGTDICLIGIYSFLSCGIYGFFLIMVRVLRTVLCDNSRLEKENCKNTECMSVKVRFFECVGWRNHRLIKTLTRNGEYTKTAFSLFILCGVLIYFVRSVLLV